MLLAVDESLGTILEAIDGLGELDELHLVIRGELTRNIIGGVEVPPVVDVHAQLDHRDALHLVTKH